jgi:hypothetical protein
MIFFLSTVNLKFEKEIFLLFFLTPIFFGGKQFSPNVKLVYSRGP